MLEISIGLQLQKHNMCAVFAQSAVILAPSSYAGNLVTNLNQPPSPSQKGTKRQGHLDHKSRARLLHFISTSKF